MYALNIDKETGRILSATFSQYASANAIIVDVLPEGNILNYLYQEGQYIYDPLPEPEISETPSTDNYEARIAALEEELIATKILLGVE